MKMVKSLFREIVWFGHDKITGHGHISTETGV